MMGIESGLQRSKPSLALVAIISLALVSAACFPASKGEKPGSSRSSSPPVAPRVGALAPDFTLSTPEGQTIKLGDFRGRPVFLNFWASWCGPCRAEMPYIQTIFKEYSPRGLVVLTVNQGEDAATVQRFMAMGGFTFPAGLDQDLRVSETYLTMTIPTSFLIDRDGIIRYSKVGAFASKAEIEARLKAIM